MSDVSQISAPVVDALPPTPDQLLDAVRSKLQSSILRRTSGAKAVSRELDFRVYEVSSWAREILLASAAIGLSHPLVLLLNPPVGSEPKDKHAELSAIAGYPPALFLGCVVLIAAWIVMRAYIAHKKLAERGPLLSACKRELEGLQSDLEDALGKAEPLPGLDEVAAKAREIVDRYHRMGVWPWAIGPDGIGEQLKQEANELCEQFRGQWRIER